MAKSAAKKKTEKTPGKSPAAFASTEDGLMPADDNPSKFNPTSDANMDMQQLDFSDGLVKLFVDSVKDIYWAEKHLVKALPKMAKSAATDDLSNAILDHLEQTKTHVERLEKVFTLLGKKPEAKKCDAMEGLTKEGEGVIENTDKGTPARDLGIIMASQKVEHYEIASYTGLIKLAGQLGLNEIADTLAPTLAEEHEADATLSEIAGAISINDNNEA